jgi:O-antigen ligase
MTFSEWKYWLRSLPWQLKWFVILVLIRPVVDNFYYLKNISPFLSPLYIVGIATPVLCVAAMLFFRKKDRSVFDFLFGGWALVMCVSLVAMFIYDPLSKTFLEYFLKLTMPVYLYFFLRLLIRSQRDLDGVLQTFIYSSLFVVAIFLFEIIVNPVKVLKTRGLERIQGSYGDVMNYAIYMAQGFLIMSYFFLRNRTSANPVSQIRNLVITIILCMACLFKISHTASYGVFIGILMLFVLFNLKTNKSLGFFIIITILTAAYFFGAETIEQKINPLIKTDVAVYEGKKESGRLLHGRVGRWQGMLEEYSEFPVYAQLFGMPLALREAYAYISTGAHNDFIRILFYSGLLGLIFYLLIIFNVFKRMRFLKPENHFLALGAMTILLFYSISTCPTLYAPMLYVLFSILCFLALPETVLKQPGHE